MSRNGLQTTLKRSASLAVAWLMLVSALPLLATDASAQEIEDHAPTSTLRQSIVDAVPLSDASGAHAGVSSFGSAAQLAIAFDTAGPCDADGDGEFDGEWRVEQVDGNTSDGDDDDDIVQAWNDDNIYNQMSHAPQGYRYVVEVCDGGLDGDGVPRLLVEWPDQDLVLADEAAEWYADALADAKDALRLPFPGWQTWPDRKHNQIVHLPTWLYIANNWYQPGETKRGAGPHYPDHPDNEREVEVFLNAVPVRSHWEFTPERDEQVTFACEGRGNQWQPGIVGPPACFKNWEHSTSIIGNVKIRARTEFLVTVTTTLNNDEANGSVIQSVTTYTEFSQWNAKDLGDAHELRVGEVQTYGVLGEVAVGVPEEPAGPTQGGLPEERCWAFGIGFVCDVTDIAVQIAQELGELALPFLEPLVDFLQGCWEAIKAAGESVESLIRTIFNPSALKQAWDDINAVREALLEDPGAFAAEVLGEALHLDTLDEDGLATWIGEMACEMAIGALTGFASGKLAGLADKVTDFLRKRRNNNGSDGGDGGDGGDQGDNTGDDDSGDQDDDSGDDDTSDDDPIICSVDSFPAGTEVLMSDHTYQPIELIEVGQHVWSYDTETMTWASGEVVDQWSHPTNKPIAEVTVDDGSSVSATVDHLFWEPDEQAWTALGELVSGDTLLTPGGSTAVRTVSIPPADRAVESVVWELTVKGSNTFTVSTGSVDVLVHNRCNETFPTDKDTRRTRELTDAELQHAFDKHGEEIFGRPTTMEEFREAMDRARSSRKTYESTLGDSDTIAHLARVNIDGEMRNVIVHFYVDGPYAGQFATAVRPSQAQLTRALELASNSGP